MQVNEVSKLVQMTAILEKDVDFTDEDLMSTFNPSLKQFRQAALNRIANKNGYEHGECLGYVSGNFVNVTFIKYLREEDEGMAGLKMLTTEEVAELIGTTRQNVLCMKDVGILKFIKTGASFMFPQKEIEKFQETYLGYDLGNKVKMIAAYREVHDAV